MVKHWLPQMAVCLVGLMFQRTRCADESSLLLVLALAAQPVLPVHTTDQCLFSLFTCQACQMLFATPDAVKGESQSIPQISQLRSVD